MFGTSWAKYLAAKASWEAANVCLQTHGGFGFGLTRMLMVMLGIRNVREVTFVYRGPKRLYP